MKIKKIILIKSVHNIETVLIIEKESNLRTLYMEEFKEESY